MSKNKYDVEKYFFVDYENVSSGCLSGLAMLGKDDRVRLYYGKNAAHLSFDQHLQITQCNAGFEYIKVELSIKNALDCMLLLDINRISSSLKVKNFYVVSKDSDYDEPIKELKSKGLAVSKISEIKDFNKENTGSKSKEKSKKDNNSGPKPGKDQKMLGEALSGSSYKKETEFIYSAIKNSKNKAQLNHKLQKKFEGADVKKIFKLIKSVIADMPSQ